MTAETTGEYLEDSSFLLVLIDFQTPSLLWLSGSWAGLPSQLLTAILQAESGGMYHRENYLSYDVRIGNLAHGQGLQCQW